MENAQIRPDNTIQVGLWWDLDGHILTVTAVNQDNATCEITETWVNEDTWEDMKNVETYSLKTKGNGAIISDVVGCFAECRKNEGIKRKDVINNLSPNCPLLLETAYWEGKPFFLVVDPQSGLDIGALPKENSGFLKNTFPDASFKVRLMEKNLDKPVIEIEVIR